MDKQAAFLSKLVRPLMKSAPKRLSNVARLDAANLADLGFKSMPTRPFRAPNLLNNVDRLDAANLASRGLRPQIPWAGLGNTKRHIPSWERGGSRSLADNVGAAGLIGAGAGAVGYGLHSVANLPKAQVQAPQRVPEMAPMPSPVKSASWGTGLSAIPGALVGGGLGAAAGALGGNASGYNDGTLIGAIAGGLAGLGLGGYLSALAHDSFQDEKDEKGNITNDRSAVRWGTAGAGVGGLAGLALPIPFAAPVGAGMGAAAGIGVKQLLDMAEAKKLQMRKEI